MFVRKGEKIEMIIFKYYYISVTLFHLNCFVFVFACLFVCLFFVFSFFT